jgi:hypothetical protein
MVSRETVALPTGHRDWIEGRDSMTMTVNRHGYEVRRADGTLIVRFGGGTGGVAWLQASEYVIARGWFTREEINAMA